MFPQNRKLVSSHEVRGDQFSANIIVTNSSCSPHALAACEVAGCFSNAAAFNLAVIARWLKQRLGD